MEPQPSNDHQSEKLAQADLPLFSEGKQADCPRASDEARELLTKQERFRRRDSERREQDSATDSESKTDFES